VTARRRDGATAQRRSRVTATLPPGLSLADMAKGARRRTLGRAGDLAPPALRALGAREAALASLVAAGLSDAEIAGRLSLSVRAVQPALDALFGKLRLRSRTELALLAAGPRTHDHA
jgi:DNA-binding NarL/FixJ family response regulator